MSNILFTIIKSAQELLTVLINTKQLAQTTINSKPYMLAGMQSAALIYATISTREEI